MRHPSFTDDQPAGLPLSFYRRVGDLVFIAGLGPINAQGEYLAEDFAGQFHLTMRRLNEVLTEAGVGIIDVVQVRGYVQNSHDLPEYNRLYRTYFMEPFPVRTTIVNCLPEGLLFEIDCIAVLPGASNPGPLPL